MKKRIGTVLLVLALAACGGTSRKASLPPVKVPVSLPRLPPSTLPRRPPLVMRKECTTAATEARHALLYEYENSGRYTGDEVVSYGRFVNATDTDCDIWPYEGPPPDDQSYDPCIDAPLACDAPPADSG